MTSIEPVGRGRGNTAFLFCISMISLPTRSRGRVRSQKISMSFLIDSRKTGHGVRLSDLPDDTISVDNDFRHKYLATRLDLYT